MTPPLPRRARALAARVRAVVEHELAYRARRAALDPHLVLLESFGGNGMLCNPEALFRELHAAPDLRHLRFVWALAGPGHDGTRAEFTDDPRVRFVQRRSPAYYRELGRASYLINNATFPSAFAKRPGQTYLDTWHGTPLKAMGYDMPGGALESANVVRNLLAADVLLAPNPQTAAMYLDAYRLRGLWDGRLLEVGTPRIDRQFGNDAAVDAVRERLRRSGVTLPPGARTVLYAPTWRGVFAAPDDDLDRLATDVTALRRRLEAGTALLVKVHQRVYAAAAADARLRGLLVPNEVPTNDVLAVTAVLVSDYSSITVDFLAGNRPIVRYVPDLQDYVDGRGLTVGLDALPGPVCRTVDELAGVLAPERAAELVAEAQSPTYQRARERFCALEDGHAAERVVDAVFRAPSPSAAPPAGRPRLLVHLGGLLTNGITTSGLSLLTRLDHDRLDVTVTFPTPRTADALRHATSVDPRVRVVPRVSGRTWTQLRATPLPAVGGRLPAARRPDRLVDEWRRCFGDSRVDHVVDFSGYSAFWARLLLAAPAGRHATWLHNDMRAEMTSRGRDARLRAAVRRTVRLYRAQDRLVSVSPSLTEINRRSLARYAPAERFVSARNTVDAAGILARTAEPLPDAVVLPDVVSPGAYTFVTVGRLSAEKNHERLLRAFAAVHAETPAVRLVVVGAGPLEDALRATARELGIAAAVTFTGRLGNPYPVLAAADCVVLSSDYEGQPIVLLEALVLGRPIVTTDFASVADALPPGAGLVVRRDDGALADGLRAAVAGRVPPPAFDAEDYNAAAVAEFERALGLGGWDA